MKEGLPTEQGPRRNYETILPPLNKENGKVSGETPVGPVYLQTDFGGPRSKYKDRLFDQNEDSAFLVVTEGTNEVAFGVIDGVGGGEAIILPDGEKLFSGKQASIIANTSIRKSLAEGKTLKESAEDSRKKIMDGTEEKGAACIAAAMVKPMEAAGTYKVEFIWAGDSKLLTIRNGAKFKGGTTILENHGADMAASMGEDYPHYTAPRSNEIYNSLGGVSIDGGVVNQGTFEGKTGDALIAASDAVWDNVSDYEIAQIALASNGDAKAIEKSLYDLTYQRNNSEGEFEIQHNATEVVKKTLNRKPTSAKGDNITIAVLVLA